MYRNYMVWLLPTVAAFFATVILTICVSLAAITPSYAQSSDSRFSGSELAEGNLDINPDSNPPLTAQQTTASAESLKKAEFAEEPVQKISVASTDSPASNVLVEPKANIAIDTPQDTETKQESNLLPSDDPEIIQLTTEEQAQLDAIVAQQLTQDLEQQLQQLQQSLQTEDAFSSKLGENYLGYGKLLRKAGRVDESISALTNAFHIAKVNNGIYSIEQRPA
ncbi:MAG: hypothetical protein ACI9XU_001182, partial [Arenicella sp.]